MAAGPSSIIKHEFSELLLHASNAAFPGTKITEADVSSSISTPKTEHGDLSSSLPFKLAKTMKSNPNAIAEAIAKAAKKSKYVKDVKALGGYVNAWVDELGYSRLVLETIAKEGQRYGSGDIGKGEKVIVESPAVNPNKPWHIGQLRNAILGNVIANVYDSCGYSVEREDYIDDLGLQISESLWGYLHLSNKPDKKVDQWFGEQYVEVNKVMATKDIQAELNALLKMMEKQEGREAKLAKEIAEMCVRAQYQTAFDYGICFNVMIWESSIVKAKVLEKAIEMADKKGILSRPKDGKFAGCIVVDLQKGEAAGKFEGNEETVKVLVRSSGVATYVAKDFAFHMWKFGLIKADFKYSTFVEKQPNKQPLYTTSDAGEHMGFGNVKKVINLIGSEQKYEQNVLKTLFSLLGRNDIADNIIHLAYGLVSVESGSLSGRTGGWLGSGRNYTADDLLREVKEKAKEIVMQSEKIADKSHADEIAKSIAISAIKFEYLRVAPEKEVIFSWKKALDFESNSGPYCMYTYARASRILEKAGDVSDPKDGDYKRITRGLDFELVKTLGLAQELVEKTHTEYRPNNITEYLLNISSLFSRFYEGMPVLKGGDAKDVRLAIVSATRQVTKNMLGLLGIEPVSTM